MKRGSFSPPPDLQLLKFFPAVNKFPSDLVSAVIAVGEKQENWHQDRATVGVSEKETGERACAGRSGYLRAEERF